MATRSRAISPWRYAIGVVVVFAAVLAGCAPLPTQDEPQPTPTAPVEENTPAPAETDAEAEPDPAPTAEEPPVDPATWEVSNAGIGPLSVGASLSSTVASQPGMYWSNDEGYCPRMWEWHGAEGGLKIVMHRAAAADGPIETIVLTGNSGEGPKTARGIGLGSTAAEMRTAFSSWNESKIHNAEKYFEAPEGSGTYFVLDDGDAVKAIVLTSLNEPVMAFCGT